MEAVQIDLMRVSDFVSSVFMVQLQGHGAHFAPLLSTGVSSGGVGPGDGAMAGGVMNIAPFAEDPPCAVVGFPQGKVIAGDVLLGSGKTVGKLAGALIVSVGSGLARVEIGAGLATGLSQSAALAVRNE